VRFDTAAQGMTRKKSRKVLTEFSTAQGYDFHVPGLGTASRVDRPNGIIRGVGLITSGVQARGHELHTDATTLAQMLACATKRGKVPVKLNHPSAIENVCGYVTNFAIREGKLIGDWHLLKSHDEYEPMLERAERMPECFGMSGAFMGEAEVADGRQLARCSELLAFDCVAQPAAMPSGLFERGHGAGVDTPEQGMNTDPNAVPAEMPAWFQPFAAQFQTQGEQLAALTAHVTAQQQQALADHLLGMTAEERDGLTAEDMAEYGITAEDLAQINAVAAEMGGEGAEGAEGSPGADGAGRSGTVAAGPGQSNAVVAAMQAEIKQLKTFQAGIAREKLNELEARRQGEVDAAITALEEKSAALLVELEAKDALIVQFQNSTHIPASRNASETLFEAAADGEGTEFSKKVTAKFTELQKLNPNTTEKHLSALRAEATRFCVRRFPQLFAAHRGGAIQLGR